MFRLEQVFEMVRRDGDRSFMLRTQRLRENLYRIITKLATQLSPTNYLFYFQKLMPPTKLPFGDGQNEANERGHILLLFFYHFQVCRPLNE